MPAQYEKIRDSYVARGKSYDEAQRIAAATYNSTHKQHPVTGRSEGDRGKMRREAMLKQMGRE